MASQRPAALLFDVNGTLFPADSCAAAFRRAGLPGSAVEVRCALVRCAFSGLLLGGHFLLKCATEDVPCIWRAAMSQRLVQRWRDAAAVLRCCSYPVCFPPAPLPIWQVWFARILRDGFAAQLTGGPHVTFRQLAEHHLSGLLAEHPVSPRVVGSR